MNLLSFVCFRKEELLHHQLVPLTQYAREWGKTLHWSPAIRLDDLQCRRVLCGCSFTPEKYVLCDHSCWIIRLLSQTTMFLDTLNAVTFKLCMMTFVTELYPKPVQWAHKREGGWERQRQRFIPQRLRFWATAYTYLQRRTGFITWFLAYCHLCGLMWFCSYLFWLPFSPCLQWKCLHSHFCRHPWVQNTIFLH